MQNSTKIILKEALDANYHYYTTHGDRKTWEIIRQKLLEILTKIFKDRTLSYSYTGLLSEKEGTTKMLFDYDGKNVIQDGKILSAA